ARNVIAANGNHGVWINGSGATGNLVQGNYIGVGGDGGTALGNSFSGVHIASGASNTIGGTTASARNIISANGFISGPWSGIDIEGTGATGNFVQGNYIGTDSSG